MEMEMRLGTAAATLRVSVLCAMEALQAAADLSLTLQSCAVLSHSAHTAAFPCYQQANEVAMHKRKCKHT